MKKINELVKYDFHDSLLEGIIYDKPNNRVTLKIDFCNWKQKWYYDGSQETLITMMIFENVADFSMPEVDLNSDEIIDFEILDNGVKVSAYNDIRNLVYCLMINSVLVDFDVDGEDLDI